MDASSPSMARPQKSRKVVSPPKMKGFEPYGMPMCKTEPVIMKYEEYESLKLINYDGLQQDQAAGQMNVSRPTFTRIYNRALKLIAKSFVEGKAIEIQGGNFEFEKEWFRCRKCYKLVEGLENHVKCENCKLFGDTELVKVL
jgi:predicted DNA-binding protein (UPF0251 family)